MLVSLLMPAFIRDEANLRYLEEALDSALAQTYKPLEILVIDDGSPLAAEVEALVRRKNSPKVRYISKPNGGVADALNLGLREMGGEYFTWLSHDDLYLPNKVESQMRVMASMPAGTILYCDVEHVDSQGGHLFFEYTTDLAPHQCRTFFAQYGAHNANSHLIPRKCFDSVGEFNINLKTTQDNDMWFRLSKFHPFQRVPEILMKYRNHPTQDSRSPVHLRECNELYISFLENLERDEIVRNSGRTPGRYYAECACLRGNRGYFEAARHAAGLAIREFLRHPFAEWGNRNFILGTWRRLGKSSLQESKQTPLGPNHG
jgi:glycosyltransferase involved in cell wall biosynthesis